ncbi:Poly(A)-specific ribonuclease [Bertholletia excelsa]
MEINEVWAENLDYEVGRIASMLDMYTFVALDTEFPGFLSNTPRYGSQEQRYQDLKINVESLKMIQLGLTLFNSEGRIGGSWQINFSDFDASRDLHVEASVRLLRKSGIDLEKNTLQGVEGRVFAKLFFSVLSNHRNLKWVSFHGLYDFAYVFKIVSGAQVLPPTLTHFAYLLWQFFDSVCDVKYMARFCEGLMMGELGLERMAKILHVHRRGQAHQAGSDSLLTARVFARMKEVYGLDAREFEGFLYGIDVKVERKVMVAANAVLRAGQYYRFIPLRGPPYAVTCPSPYVVPVLPTYPVQLRPVYTFLC